MKKIMKSILVMLMLFTLPSYAVKADFDGAAIDENNRKIVEEFEYESEKVVFYELNGDGVLFEFWNKNGYKEEFYRIGGVLYRKIGADYEFIGEVAPPYQFEKIGQASKAIPVGWSTGKRFVADDYTVLPTMGTVLNYASIIAGVLSLSVSLGMTLASMIIDYDNNVKEVYIDYTPVYYNYCSILEGKTDISIFHANRIDNEYFRGSNIAKNIVGGWNWTQDPSLYTSPAACRQYVGQYKYKNGEF